MASMEAPVGAWSRVGQALSHPIRVVVAAFAAAILIGTLLLSAPLATASGEAPGLVTALFTATSAVCVTGLVLVDTGSYWSGFGQGVILLLIQIGGLGIMTLASVLAVLIGRRIGVRASLLSGAEARHGNTAGMSAREVVVGVVRTSLLFEAAVAVVLILRFALSYDESPGRAVYLGVFHAVSAFNNAGFALWSDSIERFALDPVVSLVIAGAIICGGLGFPVLWELRRRWRRPNTWSLHSRITVGATTLLLVISTGVITLAEWGNEATMGAFPAPGKVLAGFFHAVNTRTAGFNSLPTGDLRSESLLASDLLMFIGGGSAGTAGGIKVTTFVLMGYVMWAELRGERRVVALRRTIPSDVQRQALTIAFFAVTTVIISTWLLLATTAFSLDVVLFEVTSAFGTVGLSTGITASLPTHGQLVLTALMFIGRLGPLTVGASLALRARPRRFEYPEERTIVG
ncbi:potassium transporter TrkG [Intrasporangium sp. DVR]|uniref:TrkH family potassium uptake protein n=1 Tax=Intrasporangium sp. DVR TaxID=3127867 RepID=UPI00313A6992